MGSYAQCKLGSLYVGSTKNDVDYALMDLFRAADKRQGRFALKDLPDPIRPLPYDEQENEDEELDVVYYSIPARLVKERLELKGYTLSTAKEAFMRRIRAEIKENSETEIEDLKKFYAAKVELLKSLDVETWLDNLREIKRFHLCESRFEISHEESEKTLKGYMLRYDWFGFSGIDLYVPLRLALEICDDDDNFVYDLTDLVGGGYIEKDEDFAKLATEFYAAGHSSSSKTIVLTEGSSDTWIIADSLKLLYPHLADYFSFMDFELANMEGGASHLARIVKAFAGAGIVNKVLAIFDNDTAGEEAIQTLRDTQLPGNLRVIQLPPLDFLRRYPTQGPTGRFAMDVNGLAGSIELYLGIDVLAENGNSIPVQWKSYSSALSQYQGEVLDKSGIQRRFKSKVRDAEDGAATENADWSGMAAILAAIFSAFHSYDREMILAEGLEQYTRG